MYVVHFKRRSAILALTGVLLAAVLALVLAGCFGGRDEEAPVTLADEAARAAYLEGLGWQVSPQPLETLDLQLPDGLEEKWADYTALQKQQGFPFADYGGQPVRRYTYAIGNYPGVPEGVQANLYLCGDTLIGGDVIATGKGGFQRELAYPKG